MTASSPFNAHHEADAHDSEHLTLVNGRFFIVLDRNGEILKAEARATREAMRQARHQDRSRAEPSRRQLESERSPGIGFESMRRENAKGRAFKAAKK